MADLSIDAVSVAVVTNTTYLPVTSFVADLPARARLMVESGGVPREHLMVLDPADTAGSTERDVSTLALDALGPPAADQPLFFVRSGPLRDPLVAAMAGLVHNTGWAGEDIGITHLDELGGTVIFDLLGWAVPEETGATALICDEPLFADARLGPARFTAVGLRLRRGPGPLRVLGCGEGAPGRHPATVRFAGTGPCDSWLALHTAVAAGEIVDGDRVLLHTVGPVREGWLSFLVADTAGLRTNVPAGTRRWAG